MNSKGVRQQVKGAIIVAAITAFVAASPTGVFAANKLIVQDSPPQGVTPTNKFVVTDSGFIGSGTDAPAVALHAKGTPSGAQFRAHSNTASASAGASFVMLHNNGSVTALPALPGQFRGVAECGKEW